jgi:hypothetical protein
VRDPAVAGRDSGLEDEEFGAGDASSKGLSLFNRLDGIAPCVDHQRRGADGRQQGADVE